MDGGAWWAAVHGVAESWTRLSGFAFTFHFHALEKEMATHSSVLAWRIPGTGESVGLPSMGSHRVGHDWSDLAAAACMLSHSVTSDCLRPHGLYVATPWPGSAVHGIFQSRILERVAISYFKGSFPPRDRTWVSCSFCIGRQILYHCVTWEAHIPSTQRFVAWLAWEEHSDL